MKATKSNTSISKAGWRTQCTAKSKRSGEQCKRPQLPGLTVCRVHGGASPKAAAVVVKERARREVQHEMTRMERFVGLIDENDPEARGDVSLVVELRRTVNRIRIFDEWIVDLNEGAIGWGRTFFERKDGEINFITGQNDSYKQTRYEARANILYSMQMEERKHLVNISKVWIGAGFKARELDLAERQFMAFNNTLLELCKALGHDPADPAIRMTVHRVMALHLKPEAEVDA